LQRDPQKFILRINRAIEQSPDQGRLYEILGRTYLSVNDRAKAEGSYLKAVELEPQNVAYLQALANFYAAVGKIDKSTEILEALPKDDPANAGSQAGLAEKYLNEKAFQKASALADEMLKTNPKSADGLVLKGRILLAQNRNAEAMIEFQSAVAIAPYSAMSRYFLGLSHLQSGNREAAEKEWTKAARSPGRFLQPTLGLAQLKLEAGDNDAALHYAQQVLKIASNHGEARLILGTAYAKKEDFSNAVRQLEQYVQLNPADPRGQQRLGAAYLSLGNLARSEAQFEAALKLDPGSLDGLAGLTSLYILQKKQGRAIQRLEHRLVQLSGPALGPILRLMADVFASQKNLARAEEYYKLAIQADPKADAQLSALARFYEHNRKPVR
jgi:tetratricopeptide (TPR) repeat protein